MPSFSTLLAATALASVGAAVPTKQGFSIPLVPKNSTTIPYGQHLTAKVYKKFGKDAPSHVVAAAAAVTGSVTATPEDAYDSEYLAPVTVGSTTLNLDFDTGSADLYVF
jgi:hypothetical protein